MSLARAQPDPEPQEQIMRIEYFVAQVMDSQRRHDTKRRRTTWSTLPQRSRRQRTSW